MLNTVGHLCRQGKNRIQHFRSIEGENVYPQLQWRCCDKLLEDDRNGLRANNLQKQPGGRELEYRPSHHQIEV